MHLSVTRVPGRGIRNHFAPPVRLANRGMLRLTRGRAQQTKRTIMWSAADGQQSPISLDPNARQDSDDVKLANSA